VHIEFLLFDEIENSIIDILTASNLEVPKENFVRGNILIVSNEKAVMPALSLYDIETAFLEANFGSNIEEKREENQDSFSGDSVQTTFVLSKRPLKPVGLVETPVGTPKREDLDFHVDYVKGSIEFAKAPDKGSNNIVATFTPFSGMIKVGGLRVVTKYKIDSWASTRNQCDDIATSVMRTLLLEKGKLAADGYTVKLISCSALTTTEPPQAQLFCRSLEYEIETQLTFEQPLEAVESIVIQQKQDLFQ
jgi:hypothetical protein